MISQTITRLLLRSQATASEGLPTQVADTGHSTTNLYKRNLKKSHTQKKMRNAMTLNTKLSNWKSQDYWALQVSSENKIEDSSHWFQHISDAVTSILHQHSYDKALSLFQGTKTLADARFPWTKQRPEERLQRAHLLNLARFGPPWLTIHYLKLKWRVENRGGWDKVSETKE